MNSDLRFDMSPFSTALEISSLLAVGGVTVEPGFSKLRLSLFTSTRRNSRRGERRGRVLEAEATRGEASGSIYLLAQLADRFGEVTMKEQRF